MRTGRGADSFTGDRLEILRKQPSKCRQRIIMRRVKPVRMRDIIVASAPAVLYRDKSNGDDCCVSSAPTKPAIIYHGAQ